MKRFPWQEEFIKSLLDTYSTVDASTWFPFSGDALVPYYFTLYCQRIAQALRNLKANKITPKEAAFKMQKASVLRSELDMLISYLGSGILKLSPEDAKTIFDFFSQMLISLNPKDPFCYRGKNQLLDQGFIDKLISQDHWQRSTHEDARSLGKLIASLSALYCSIYTDLWPASGVEFHGPYQIDFQFKKRVLLIRDYYDIAPREIWPSFRDFQPKSVRIVTIYKPSKFFIDYYGNITCSGNMLNLLEACEVITDKKTLSLEKMSSLTDRVGKKAARHYEYPVSYLLRR